jgi:hypothetical protein
MLGRLWLHESSHDGYRPKTLEANHTRDAQTEAQKQFKSALEQFGAVVKIENTEIWTKPLIISTNLLPILNNNLQNARNRYNSSVGRFNTLIESFSARFIAKKFGFEKRNYFSLDLVTQQELPEVDFSAPSISMK